MNQEDKEFSLWDMERRKQEMHSPNGESQPEESRISHIPASADDVNNEHPDWKPVEPSLDGGKNAVRRSRSHISHTKMADLWQTSTSKKDMDVHKFWEIIKRYRLVISVITLIICGTNLIFTYNKPDEYQAVSTLRLTDTSSPFIQTQSMLKTLKSEITFPKVMQNTTERINFLGQYFIQACQFDAIDKTKTGKTKDVNDFEVICAKLASEYESYLEKKNENTSSSTESPESDPSVRDKYLSEIWDSFYVKLPANEKKIADSLEKPFKEANFINKWIMIIKPLDSEIIAFYKNEVSSSDLEKASKMSLGEIQGMLSSIDDENQNAIQIIAQGKTKHLVAIVANSAAEGLISFQKEKLKEKSLEAEKIIKSYTEQIKAINLNISKILEPIKADLNKKWKEKHKDQSDFALIENMLSRSDLYNFNESDLQKIRDLKTKAQLDKNNYENRMKALEEMASGSVKSDSSADQKDKEMIAEILAKNKLEEVFSEYKASKEQKVRLKNEISYLKTLYKSDYYAILKKEEELAAIEKTIKDIENDKKSIIDLFKKEILAGTSDPSAMAIPLSMTRNNLQQLLSAAEAALSRETKQEDAANMLFSELKKHPELQVAKDKIKDTEELRRAWNYKKTELNSETAIGLQIANPATPPAKPFAPNRIKIGFLGFLVGAVIALGVAFFLEYMDNTIKTPIDIRSELNLNTLGIIPKWGKKDAAHVAPDDPKSIVGEVFGVLRNNIRYSSRLFPEKMLLIASALKGEGKSYVASNLAVSFSTEGAKTVLVNADLRKTADYAYVHAADGYKGLSDFLEGNVEIKDVVSPTDVPDLYYVSCGHKVDHPAKDLRSERMIDLLEELERTFDVVIIDVPAVLPVVDTTTFSNRVRGVLMIVSAGSSPNNAVKHAVDRLRHVKSPIIGAVLNNAIDTNVTAYYGDSYYYYEQENKNLRRTIMKKLRGF